MKKIVSVILTMTMMFTLFGAFTVRADEDFSLTMQIGSPIMTVNGAEKPIDGEGTAPVIVNERTLLPVRAVVEEMGGTVAWNGEIREVTLNVKNDEIKLTIDSPTAYLNGRPQTLDTAPAIINDRTMLPIRFIAESFKFAVAWNGDTQTVTITKAKTEDSDAVSSATAVTTASPEITATPETTEAPKMTAAPAPTVIPEATIVPEATAADDNTTLVAYFSRAGENYNVGTVDKGNTSFIADYIAEQTGADVFEITAKDPYPQSYEETKTRATKEKNEKARPEINNEIADFEKYDIVFVGYPIWWGSMPMIMYTFLEKYDMTGKTVIPFSTNEGSGWGSSKSELNTLCSGADIQAGLSMTGSEARKDNAKDKVVSWLNEMGY